MDNYDNSVQVKSDYHNTDISFSPSVIAAATINFIAVQNAEISLLNKFVGRQYLDNTENKTKSLNPFNVHDLRVTYTIKKKLFREWNLIGFANNLFNKLYEPNGYTFSYVSGGTTTTENYYYPMAGRNYMIGVNVKM
jgi:iron complex outermembrane receptor protein